MEKQLKQNFIELPLNTFKKKHYPIPHFLFETKFQKNQKNLQEIKKLIESQDYEYLGQVSDERNLYCCKQKTNERLVMIEIKQVGSKNNKSIYLSINLTSALKKYIRKYFMLKSWKILDKIVFQDDKGQSSLVLLEYNFVETDLRNFIKRQYELDDKATTNEITNICKDIIENLCYYHLESTVLLDIRPQTIMYEDGKWFILPGDNTVSNKTTQFGASMSKIIGFRPVACSYLSPIMYESFMKNDSGIIHNPYKSDVYSLGLVLWQLLMMRVIDQNEIKSKFQNRKESHVGDLKNKSFNVREKIKIQNNNFLIVPNILNMMLEEHQQKRSYIIQICLTLNFTSSLFSRIIVPFQKFFKKEVIDITSTRKKIQYPHANMEYEGQTVTVYDQLIKHGRGTIIYSNLKVFDGQWQNNLPHGKCTCSFSESWNYEGIMENGKLHGQGILTFNGIRISGTKWNQNLNQDTIFANIANPEPGYYYLCPNIKTKTDVKKNENGKNGLNSSFSNILMSQTGRSFSETSQGFGNAPKNNFYKNILENDYRVFYNEEFNEKSKFIINLSLVQAKQMGKIVEILLSRKLFLTKLPFQISLYQKVKYQKYQAANFFDLIRIGIEEQTSNNPNSQRYPFKTGQRSVNFPHSQFETISQTSNIYYIDLIINAGSRSIVLNSLLYHLSRNQGYILPLLDLSNCSLNNDQFRDVIQCGIKFESIDISNSVNLSDLAIRYLVQCSNITNTITSLNLQKLKISNQALQEFKYCEWLKRLKVLNLSYCQRLTNDNIVEFLCDQRLISLQILQICAINLTHRGLQKIVNHSSLRSLKKLNVGSCHQLTQTTLAQFIKSPQLSNLEFFQCSSTTLKDTFLEVLADQNSLSKIPTLKKLNISGSINLSVFGISKFLLSKNSKSLLSINLSNLDLNDDFIELLAKKNLLSPNLTELNLSACYKVTDKSIKQLLKSERLINIKFLDLSKTNVSNDTLFLLAQSNSRKIRHLKVYKCSKMNDSGFQKFLLSPAISDLKKLQIGGTSVRQLFFTTFGSQKCSSTVQQLYLNECQQINQKAFCHFLGSKKMTRLRLIDVSSTRFTNKVIQAMNKNPFLKFHLVHLITNNCLNPKGQELINMPILFLIQQNISSQNGILRENPSQLAENPLLLKMTQFQSPTQIIGIQKLFTSIYLINLTKLSLKWQQCTLSLKSLAESKVLNSLKEISFVGSKFKEQTLIDLIKSPTIKSLETLNLSWTDITNQTLSSLATSTYLFSLRNLNLSKCSNFNDKGLIKFLQSGKVTLLTVLDLRSTLITNASIEALAKSKSIKSLTKLIVRSCPNISEVGFKEYFASGVCSTLKQLDVGWTRVEGNLFSFIVKSKSLQLNSLKIAGLKKIQFEFVKFLQNISSSMIQQLELNFTQITLTTIETIVQTKFLQSLQKLQLLGFDFVGSQEKANLLIKLLESINMSKITNLKLTFSNCSEKVYCKIFDSIQKNLHVLQKLYLIGANASVLQKGKKLFKKCQIIIEE